jgi:COMPASS component SWD2
VIQPLLHFNSMIMFASHCKWEEYSGTIQRRSIPLISLMMENTWSRAVTMNPFISMIVWRGIWFKKCSATNMVWIISYSLMKMKVFCMLPTTNLMVLYKRIMIICISIGKLMEFNYLTLISLHLDSIRYLSLHDNQYIRYFKGHRARVVSLCMSPVDDTFISGSVDNTVMFWDLRSPNAQGKIDVRGSPAVAYDPKGLCFAVASAINLIKMYDKRRFDQGPFAQFPIKSQSTLEFLNIKFSPGGQYISAMTNESLLLIDAYKGDKVAEFTDFCNETLLNLEASFTPDEQYLISGSENGIIHIWDSKSRFEKVTELKGHAGPVRCVKFNPYYAMLASACTNLAFWIPVSSTSMRQ